MNPLWRYHRYSAALPHGPCAPDASPAPGIFLRQTPHGHHEPTLGAHTNQNQPKHTSQQTPNSSARRDSRQQWVDRLADDLSGQRTRASLDVAHPSAPPARLEPLDASVHSAQTTLDFLPEDVAYLEDWVNLQNQPSRTSQSPPKRPRQELLPHWAPTWRHGAAEQALTRNMAAGPLHHGGPKFTPIRQTFLHEEIAPLPQDPYAGLEAFVEPQMRLESVQAQPRVPLAAEHGQRILENAPTATAAHGRRARVSQPQAEAEVIRSSLMDLGYNEKQATMIKPESCYSVINHHQALVDQDFTHAQIVTVSQRPQSLEFLAQRGMELFLKLPDLTADQVSSLAKGRTGNLVLETLLSVADDLKRAPLFLSTKQLVKIAKGGAKQALEKTLSLRHKLSGEPYNLTPEQIVAMASHQGGKQALEAFIEHLPRLIEAPYGLKTQDVVAIASHDGGKQALKALIDHLPQLIKAPYGLGTQDVVAIANTSGGNQALQAVTDHLPQLIEAPYCLETQDIVAIASTAGGKQALQAVIDLLPELIKAPYGLQTQDVVAIARHRGGNLALQTVIDHLHELIKAPYCLDTKDIVAVARHHGGKQALLAVIDHMPNLIKAPYWLGTKDVVAIAGNDGGSLALQAVIDLMPKLIKPPYSLETKEVVAIASNIGGNQALQGVFDLLPKLIEAPYCLETKDIVAIAINKGGKQALQAVIELLPKLIEAPFCYETKEVVAMARRQDGSMRLKAHFSSQ